MRGKMRLEKGKMTRKMENHCGDFFKMSFLKCHFPPLFKSFWIKMLGSLNFTREFCSDKVNCSGSGTGTSAPCGLGAGTGAGLVLELR